MEKKTKNPELMHSFSGKKSKSFLSMKIVVIFLIVILFGVGSGYELASTTGAASPTITSTNNVSKSSIHAGETFGSNDTKAYPDSVEGMMQSGGIDGEGQYHLVRPGGDSQNVYMTSSDVDLSLFIGHKVKVWGQTQTAQHAGWLMDVGKVQVE